jgi:hypothetical protein
VGFIGDPDNELPYAQLVAEAIDTVHTPIAVGPEKICLPDGRNCRMSRRDRSAKHPISPSQK